MTYIDRLHNPDLNAIVVGHVTPFLQDQEEMLSLKELLTDAGRKLLFLVERVFLPMGRSNCCIMQIHNAQ